MLELVFDFMQLIMWDKLTSPLNTVGIKLFHFRYAKIEKNKQKKEVAPFFVNLKKNLKLKKMFLIGFFEIRIRKVIVKFDAVYFLVELSLTSSCVHGRCS